MLATFGDKHVGHMRHRSVAAGGGYHAREKDIGIVVGAELPAGDEVDLRDPEPGSEIDQIAELEQLGAPLLLRMRFGLHRAECDAAADEAGLAFLNEAGKFGDWNVRPSLAMFAQHRLTSADSADALASISSRAAAGSLRRIAASATRRAAG
ncbi:MAG: hypothetical protein EOS64_30685 [Mesorhizobium sp.]|nr:MAG: hypothetical protein EOS64_30685 [Mesorhizobium sp.]